MKIYCIVERIYNKDMWEIDMLRIYGMNSSGEFEILKEKEIPTERKPNESHYLWYLGYKCKVIGEERPYWEINEIDI